MRGVVWGAKLRWGGTGLLLVLLGLGPAGHAIDPGDHLPQGQDLIERATRTIDAQARLLAPHATERMTLFDGIRRLLAWEETFARDTIAPQLMLDSARGLLVRDGIADTIVTRLDGLLGHYAAGNPEELLSSGRQAFEILTADLPVPPGRFLGFHFVHLAELQALRCDTLLAISASRRARGEAGPDAEGIADGFLRRLGDLSQLYRQTHADAGETYMSRITEEDWVVQRMRCPECGHLGLRLHNQRIGMRDEDSPACRETLYGARSEEASVLERIACRHWGHIFDARCPECQGTVEFTVPLPYYRILQMEMAAGETDAPDLKPLIKGGSLEDVRKAVEPGQSQ